MENWILIAIVSGVLTAVATWALVVWGAAIKKILANVIFTVDEDLTRRSEDEYRAIINSTMTALKERISLLERWRDDAITLEKRVLELEQKIKELREEKVVNESKLDLITKQLLDAKTELSKKEADITQLKNELDRGREVMEEYEAINKDNRVKIGALIHKIGHHGSDEEDGKSTHSRR